MNPFDLMNGTKPILLTIGLDQMPNINQIRSDDKIQHPFDDWVGAASYKFIPTNTNSRAYTLIICKLEM